MGARDKLRSAAQRISSVDVSDPHSRQGPALAPQARLLRKEVCAWPQAAALQLSAKVLPLTRVCCEPHGPQAPQFIFKIP